MAHRHPLAFLLGLQGHALLRAWAGEFGTPYVEARLTEVRATLAAWDGGELGGCSDTAETDTVTGYRRWAATYDKPGNPLIAVEEPLIRRILADLPGCCPRPGTRSPAWTPPPTRACHEPSWPASADAGGPFLRTWAAAAVDATYQNTPAAIIWHFRKPRPPG